MTRLVPVKVKPRSSRAGVRVEGGQLLVRVLAPPEKSKANREVVRLLAEFFHVPATQITIVAGTCSRFKFLRIPDTMEVQRILGGKDE